MEIPVTKAGRKCKNDVEVYVVPDFNE